MTSERPFGSNTAAMTRGLGRWRWTRRDFLRGVAVGAVGAALPPLGCGPGQPSGPPPTTGFFTAAEAAALGRLADFVLPPDSTYPGGSALGTVAYTEQLLTALDGSTPQIFRGGPYSGRAPFPDANGSATSQFPADDFDAFLPLDRVQAFAWKLRLFGSSAVPGGGPNDAVAAVGPTVGLRDQMKQALDQVVQAAPGLAAASDAAVAAAWADLTSDQRALITEMVVEGAFGAPEYGGNVGLGGWALSHFPGDQLPLGYSQWDAAAGSQVQRSDLPLTTPDGGADPDPLDQSTQQLLDALVIATGGTKFS